MQKFSWIHPNTAEVAVRAAQIRRTGARPAGSAGAGALAACLPFGWPDASFPKSEATG